MWKGCPHLEVHVRPASVSDGPEECPVLEQCFPLRSLDELLLSIGHDAADWGWMGGVTKNKAGQKHGMIMTPTHLTILSCCSVLRYETRFQSTCLLKSGWRRCTDRTLGRGGSELVHICFVSSMKPEGAKRGRD